MSKEKYGYGIVKRKKLKIRAKKNKKRLDILLGVDYIINVLALVMNEC